MIMVVYYKHGMVTFLSCCAAASLWLVDGIVAVAVVVVAAVVVLIAIDIVVVVVVLSIVVPIHPRGKDAHATVLDQSCGNMVSKSVPIARNLIRTEMLREWMHMHVHLLSVRRCMLHVLRAPMLAHDGTMVCK